MAVGPYSQDVLTRIYNVHWDTGGSTFINGGGTQRYLKMVSEPEEPPAWTDLGPLEFSSVGTVHASSYAKVGVKDDGSGGTPTFLLGGNDYGGDDFHVDNGLIMVSSDGLKWSRVLTVETGDPDLFNSASLLGIVWDNVAGCFYAGGHVSRTLERDDHSIYNQEDDVLFQSFDGRAWSEIRRETWETTSEGHTVGLLAGHCSTKVKDSFGNGVPDGVYGFDAIKDILIAPSSVPTIFYNDGVVRCHPVRTVIVRTKDENGREITKTVDVSIPVNCVAYAGGFWMAAGGTVATEEAPATIPMTAYSIDDGATWVKIDTAAEKDDPEQIATMCAAPKPDLAPKLA